MKFYTDMTNDELISQVAHWQKRAEAAERERDQIKDDLERLTPVGMGDKKYISRSKLYARFWTYAAIDKFLGRWDRKVRNTMRNGEEYVVWKLSRVLECESDPAWQEYCNTTRVPGTWERDPKETEEQYRGRCRAIPGSFQSAPAQ